ncbi:hypothetical protein DTM14_27805 [Escherichia coli]|nr:hypothetical protein DTM14_27805 [Escherichia coli]
MSKISSKGNTRYPAHAGEPRHAGSLAYSQSLEQWNKLPPIVSHIRPGFPEQNVLRMILEERKVRSAKAMRAKEYRAAANTFTWQPVQRR